MTGLAAIGSDRSDEDLELEEREARERRGAYGDTDLLLLELVPWEEDSSSEQMEDSSRDSLTLLEPQSVDASSVTPHPARMRLSVIGNRKTCFFIIGILSINMASRLDRKPLASDFLVLKILHPFFKFQFLKTLSFIFL